MKAAFTKYGVKYDYRHCQAVSPDGRLWDIRNIYREEVHNLTMADCRSFDREHHKQFSLTSLEILER